MGGSGSAPSIKLMILRVSGTSARWRFRHVGLYLMWWTTVYVTSDLCQVSDCTPGGGIIYASAVMAAYDYALRNGAHIAQVSGVEDKMVALCD